MTELESSLHLYQPPLYRGLQGGWRKSFIDAVGDCGRKLTWDVGAILGILGFCYTCGDRTLINQVKRRPWLSKIGADNEPVVMKIPGHGRLWRRPAEIAVDLVNLLSSEALEVCKAKKEIYLLLSGGLDSRIVAIILAKLYDEGKLAAKPICVTWGLDNSRDVIYGQTVAKTLRFEWQHINLDYEDVIYNIEEMSTSIGALVSPIHLHGMRWFKNVSKEAIVLSGSYGDSVGRAEFSGHHLLEINLLKPVNAFGLIRNEVIEFAHNEVIRDLKALHDRSPDEPKYVICEHEMQGHYMRNMISQAMSVIGQYCPVYQMFTHPDTYSYMWSIHPAARNDAVYAELLEQYNPQLARIPWARTNRALRGKTSGTKTCLRKEFHEYRFWVKEPLSSILNEYIDADWFAATGIFNPEKIRSLFRQNRVPSEILLWLAAFRRMAKQLESLGKTVELGVTEPNYAEDLLYPTSKRKWGLLKQILRNSNFLYRIMSLCREPFRRVRKLVVKRRAIWKYPPVKVISRKNR